ncbi:MAG: dTDP-4-amino-4,6-dideoxygalactose transaminase [Vicinamibacterales bacterium]
MSDPSIWFNRPAVTGRESHYVAEAIAAGHLAGDGAFTSRCREALETITGAGRVLLTTSCTHALEMAVMLAGVGAGDEVICPSFTFVSSVNAFVLRGGVPRFVDIRRDTLNLDERLVEAAITPRTRALMAVHYAGVGCELDVLADIAQRHGLFLIEDNAHGLFGRYRGQPLGSVGATSTLSFHETKNLTCGEGGALVLNDPTLVERAEVLREKGTNRSRFYRGQVDKYSWVDIGSSYLPSEILAAYLWAQIEAREAIQARRHAIWQRYDAELAAWADRHAVVRPTVPPHCEHPAHLYYLLLPSLAARQGLIAHLRARQILAVFHYLPLHLSDQGLKFGGAAGQHPVTEAVADQLVRLPLHYHLSPADQDRVIDAVTSFAP